MPKPTAFLDSLRLMTVLLILALLFSSCTTSTPQVKTPPPTAVPPRNTPATSPPASQPPAASTSSAPVSAKTPAPATAGATQKPASQYTPPAGSGEPVYLRLNQVGYVSNSQKLALAITNEDLTGRAFRLVDAQKGGQPLYQGKIEADRGAYENFAHVFELDFTPFSTAGAYRLEIDQAKLAFAPPFEINSAGKLFAPLLGDSLYFFQAQRDGSEIIPGVMDRQPAHLNDQKASVYEIPKYDENGVLQGNLQPAGGPVDVSGGWWDSGSSVKYVETTSYAEALMLLALRDFSQQTGPGAPADFSAEAKFGLDWLLKMWDDQQQVLYYQVGLAAGNDTYAGEDSLWRLPQEDDAYGGSDARFQYIRNRPALRAGPPKAPISPNLAGRLSAVFALCYQVYQKSDPSYANQCLQNAEHIFELANLAPQGNLLATSPYGLYPERAWQHALEWGAAEIALALSQAGGQAPANLPHPEAQYYLAKAGAWASAYITDPDNDPASVLNLYDNTGLGHYELYQAIEKAGKPAGLKVTQADLLKDLKKKLDAAQTQANSDLFQFGTGWNEFDMTARGLGLVIMAGEADRLAGNTQYVDFGRQQMDVVLGLNPWGISFIIGAGEAFPRCPVHPVANLAGALDGSGLILKGGVVAGPNSPLAFRDPLTAPQGARPCPPNGKDPAELFNSADVRYADSVAAWLTNSPTLVYSASALLALAWLSRDLQ